MDRRILIAAFVAGAFLAPAPAPAAQTPNPRTAAQLATQKAKALTYQLMSRSSGSNLGTVTLQRIGSVRSRIRVELVNPAQAEPRVTLRTGADCNEPRVAAAPHSPILLNRFTGRVSDTVVNLPLNNLTSGKYLLDVQRATGRAAALDACARLAPQN